MTVMRRRGFTLVELMVGIAVAGILLAAGAPSFTGMIARLRLEGALNELSVDLQYARSESVRERAAVALTVANDGATYAITTNAGATTLKTVTLPAAVTLTPGASVSFDSLRGMAATATFDGTSTNTAAALRANTTSMGRVQLCSPSASFGGYPSC